MFKCSFMQVRVTFNTFLLITCLLATFVCLLPYEALASGRQTVIVVHNSDHAHTVTLLDGFARPPNVQRALEVFSDLKVVHAYTPDLDEGLREELAHHLHAGDSIAGIVLLGRGQEGCLTHSLRRHYRAEALKNSLQALGERFSFAPMLTVYLGGCLTAAGGERALHFQLAQAWQKTLTSKKLPKNFAKEVHIIGHHFISGGAGQLKRRTAIDWTLGSIGLGNAYVKLTRQLVPARLQNAFLTYAPLAPLGIGYSALLMLPSAISSYFFLLMSASATYLALARLPAAKAAAALHVSAAGVSTPEDGTALQLLREGLAQSCEVRSSWLSQLAE